MFSALDTAHLPWPGLESTEELELNYWPRLNDIGFLVLVKLN